MSPSISSMVTMSRANALRHLSRFVLLINAAMSADRSINAIVIAVAYSDIKGFP